MERRCFMKAGVTALGAGGLLLHGNNVFADNPDSTAKVGSAGLPSFEMGTVTEPSREIPIAAQADVVVVGGGPAGVAAAVGAARTGAATILIERYNHLGGMWTGGLVLPLLATGAMDRNGKRRQVLHGVGGDIMERLRGLGTNPTRPDPEAAKYVLDEMMEEAGVRLLYHSWASEVIARDGSIRAVLIETKSGRLAITPKVVVDCTGDGDVFAWAGESFDKLDMGISFVCRLGKGLTNWKDMRGNQKDALDVFALSANSHEGRIRTWEYVQKAKATPGDEGVFLLETAPQVGTRASRILDGLHRLTVEESMTFKSFEDTIGVGGSWAPVNYDGKKIKAHERPMWQIPYRSLVPKKTRNLLAAGRCISCSRKLFQDVRVIGTCMVTGHGAGTAAAVVAKSGDSVQTADVGAIRKALRDQNAFLG